MAELLRALQSAGMRMTQAELNLLGKQNERLDALRKKRALTEPLAFVQDRRMQLDFAQQRARRRRTEPSRARGAALCAKRRGARRDESTEGAQPRIRDGAGGGRQRSAQRAAGTDRRPD